MKRRSLLAAAGTLWAGTAAGCVQVSREEQVQTERYRPPEGSLSVVAEAGDVRVVRTDADEVQTTLRVRYGPGGPPDVSVASSRAAGDLTLTVPDDTGGGPFGPDLGLEVGVPEGVGVGSVSTTGGDVSVADVESGVTVDANHGDVTVERVGGGVNAATSAGDVVVRDASGDVAATTSAGDVTVRRAAGDAEVTTAAGDVTIRTADGYVNAETEAGDVVVSDPGGVDRVVSQEGDLTVDVPALREDGWVSTEEGDVVARLAADLDATVAVVTDEGDLSVSEDAFDAVEEDTASYVRGILGDGTHILRVQTKRGDVSVSRL